MTSHLIKSYSSDNSVNLSTFVSFLLKRLPYSVTIYAIHLVSPTYVSHPVFSVQDRPLYRAILNSHTPVTKLIVDTPAESIPSHLTSSLSVVCFHPRLPCKAQMARDEFARCKKEGHALLSQNRKLVSLRPLDVVLPYPRKLI